MFCIKTQEQRTIMDLKKPSGCSIGGGQHSVLWFSEHMLIKMFRNAGNQAEKLWLYKTQNFLIYKFYDKSNHAIKYNVCMLNIKETDLIACRSRIIFFHDSEQNGTDYLNTVQSLIYKLLTIFAYINVFMILINCSCK